jgi:hypothetical protein
MRPRGFRPANSSHHIKGRSRWSALFVFGSGKMTVESLSPRPTSSLRAQRSNPSCRKEEWIAHMGMLSVKALTSFFDCDPRFGPISAIWICLPDQTHIRSAHEAAAPGFRLRRVGPRGRDHSSLRHLKPSNPSVRPPGSAEADRASADWLNLVVLLSCCDGCQDVSSEA